MLTSAQFSPDGNRVVTASWDTTARIWDARTGQPLGEPLRHEHYVHSAQFSPDGQWVVTASSDNTARLWDARTGQALGEPLRHQDEVWSAEFSPDGNWVVTASSDGSARIWDVHTGQAVSEPLRHDLGVGSAQFSPDGKRVVTASMDGTARVWDLPAGHGSVPLWWLDLAESMGGLRLNDQGSFVPIHVQTRLRMKRFVQDMAGTGHYTGLAKWLVADDSVRTHPPLAETALLNYVRQRTDRERVPR